MSGVEFWLYSNPFLDLVTVMTELMADSWLERNPGLLYNVYNCAVYHSITFDITCIFNL